MRLDEVPHAAEVPSLERGAKIVDEAGIGTRMLLTEGGLGIDSFSMRQEVSRGYSS